MLYSKIHIYSGIQEIISEKLKNPKCWPDPTRENPAKSWPDTTRPAGPSDPWTTLRSPSSRRFFHIFKYLVFIQWDVINLLDIFNSRSSACEWPDIWRHLQSFMFSAHTCVLVCISQQTCLHWFARFEFAPGPQNESVSMASIYMQFADLLGNTYRIIYHAGSKRRREFLKSPDWLN